MPRPKAKTAAGWSAGAVALVGALAAAIPAVRPLLADMRLSDGDRAQLREIGAHAIDKPVDFRIIGTSRGVVELAVFETGCVRVASANRLRYLAAKEHESADAAIEPPIRAAGVLPLRAAAPSCREAREGQCAIPRDHPTWDRSQPIRDLGDGWMLLHLIWEHGDVLEAKYNAQTGAFLFERFICCAH